MKSSLKEGLFLLFWLLFFILLIYKEFKTTWIPDSLKTEVLQSQLENKLEEIDIFLVELSQSVGDRDLNFIDFTSLNIRYPLFIYQGNSLVFWNNNETRPPANILKLSKGIHYRNNGFSQTILIVERNKQDQVFLVILPLWKNVGIENEWLSEGSSVYFSFKWKISDTNQCSDRITLNEELKLNICYEEQESNSAKNKGGIDFALISFFLILLSLSYYRLKKTIENFNGVQKKNTGLVLVFLIVLLLAYEYSRRFLFDPSPNSVFFVVYPYLIAFLLSSSILLLPIDTLSKRHRHFIIPILLFAVYAFCKSYWIEIFDKESFDLDLINFVRFEWKTLDAYLGLFGMSLVFFIASTRLITLIQTDNDENRARGFYISLSLGIVLFLLEGILYEQWYFAYLIIGAIYCLSTANYQNFKSFIIPSNIAYLISSIFLIAFFITETTGYGNQKKQIKEMTRFASRAIETQFEIEKDLLGQAARNIEEDKLIYIAFSNPLTSRDIIIQKIKKVYLDSYFDPFEVNIDFLNSNGDNLNPQSGYRNLFYFKSNYLKSNRQVSKGVFLIDEKRDNKSNDYFIHIELKNKEHLIGHIIIEVFRDKSSPNSIFPKLLVDKKYRDVIDYKYSIYKFGINETEQITKQFGLGSKQLDIVANLQDGGRSLLMSEGKRFLVLKNGSQVLIISKNKTGAPLISSFSIVFMILSFLSIILYWLIEDSNYKLSELPFRQKIQFFMNLAFLLPLIIVSLAVLKFMNDNDRENVESNYLEKVRVISEGIEIPFLDYKNGLIPKRVFLERASKTAGLFSLDYFIYNLDGTLNSSSKEILWERGITNRLIEPGAYYHFKEVNKDYLIRENQINDFKYKIAYASLEDLNNSEIGILGVPFYESREELESRFIQLLSTVINIFVLTFIVFLIFSNRLTDWLMVPVLRLSERIKITSFENKNEPLEWNTKDEIGRLVKSYNVMINKLNESRDALARTEKEAAWREMAQQVAHEIKNPLTPMRLRLQQLIRQQDQNNPESEKLKQTLNSLLHQVDTLSEIATSFSEFARMPNPKNEKVNLNEVLQLASNIYLGKKDIELNLVLTKKQLFTNADENMLSRSVGNIILNAIQSVHDDKNPEINISLRAQGQMAEIRIKDNGEGIEEELKDRIFIPHFSTKSSGTGIGLALAKKTIESAHGNITFESDERGTEFLIRLPLIED